LRIPKSSKSGIGHTKRTPLKGLRFESLEEAQAYLDRWEDLTPERALVGSLGMSNVLSTDKKQQVIAH
jgi:hypothetical protein